MSKNSRVEDRRIKLQCNLDGVKTRVKRNQMGQFATPFGLACELAAVGLALLPKSTPLRFLDPGLNTGALYSGLLAKSGRRRIQSATGIEIDTHYAIPTKALWRQSPLEIIQGDFTRLSPPPVDSKRATLMLCNPPYVRHHHIRPTEKARLQAAVHVALDVKLSGRSGLYCYFMALAYSWLCDGGIAGFLVPSEFMDVGYGDQVKQYLLREVTLIGIHRFDPNDAQFGDAMVSSAIVWFKKEKPPANHKVRFSLGGTQEKPAIAKDISTSVLARTAKWTRFPKHGPEREYYGYRLGDLFEIKRGIVTGANDFFIVDNEKAQSLKLSRRYLRPILPVARHINGDEIDADSSGAPLLGAKALMLIDCDRPEREIARDEPSLWAYLQSGIGNVAKGYICRSRKLWYVQEQRAPAPIVATSAGRSDAKGRRPFRFMLNRSLAIATNTLLMLYPKPILGSRFTGNATALRPLLHALNRIDRETLLTHSHVYGGGMHKMEPGELASIPADALAKLAGLPMKARVR
jgi:adenine-specific DNA-methyltransferase